MLDSLGNNTAKWAGILKTIPVSKPDDPVSKQSQLSRWRVTPPLAQSQTFRGFEN
jgi:hypothetical protein